MTKDCSICKKNLPLSSFPFNGKDGPLRSYCKKCNSKRAKARYDPEYSRTKALEAKYGISLEEYNFLLAVQKGCCATCGSSNPGSVNVKNFCVDHDHATGEIRGLLCVPCNTALGLINDRIEVLGEMLMYIKTGGTIGRVTGEVEK